MTVQVAGMVLSSISLLVEMTALSMAHATSPAKRIAVSLHLRPEFKSKS